MVKLNEESFEFELDPEQIKQQFSSLEARMRDDMRALSVYRTKQSFVRQQARELRTKIKLKDTSASDLLDLFNTVRATENRLSTRVIPEYREALESSLDTLLVEYKNNLAALQRQCETLKMKLDLTSFATTLQQLKEASGKKIIDYKPFVYEQMQALLEAARDALNNTSWEGCVESLNLMWRALKQACTRLLGMSTLIREDQELLLRGEEYYGLNIPSEPAVNDRTYQFIDDKIKILFEDFQGMKAQTLPKAQDVVDIRHDIQQLLRGARMKNISFTPVQRAALHELRAETKRMFASHAVSTQGMFKQLMKQGKDEVQDQGPDYDYHKGKFSQN